MYASRSISPLAFVHNSKTCTQRIQLSKCVHYTFSKPALFYSLPILQCVSNHTIHRLCQFVCGMKSKNRIEKLRSTCFSKVKVEYLPFKATKNHSFYPHFLHQTSSDLVKQDLQWKSFVLYPKSTMENVEIVDRRNRVGHSKIFRDLFTIDRKQSCF